MNELLFFAHTFAVLSFLLLAFRLGRDALIAFIALSWLLANLFVTKSIVLFGFEVTPTDVYTIAATLGLAILQEFWGKETAKKCVWITFFLLLFTSLQSLFQLHYTPSAHDIQQPHFEALLSPTFRLVGASLLTYLATQYFEIGLFALLQRSQKLPFFLRAFLTEGSVQIIDTLLFSLIGLAGLVPSLFDVIVVSYLIKLTVILLAAPFIALTTKIYRHAEV